MQHKHTLIDMVKIILNGTLVNPKPKITKRHNKNGSIDILIDDFVYVTVNYSYEYTNNALRAQLADEIVALLEKH